MVNNKLIFLKNLQTNPPPPINPTPLVPLVTRCCGFAIRNLIRSLRSLRSLRPLRPLRSPRCRKFAIRNSIPPSIQSPPRSGRGLGSSLRERPRPYPPPLHVARFVRRGQRNKVSSENAPHGQTVHSCGSRCYSCTGRSNRSTRTTRSTGPTRGATRTSSCRPCRSIR